MRVLEDALCRRGMRVPAATKRKKTVKKEQKLLVPVGQSDP